MSDCQCPSTEVGARRRPRGYYSRANVAIRRLPEDATVAEVIRALEKAGTKESRRMAKAMREQLKVSGHRLVGQEATAAAPEPQPCRPRQYYARVVRAALARLPEGASVLDVVRVLEKMRSKEARRMARAIRRQLKGAPMPTVGAEIMAEPGVQGVWLKTHIVRRGTHLLATTYIVSDGNMEVLKIRLDVRPIMKRLMRLHRQMHAAEEAVSGDTVGFGFKAMGSLAKKAWGAGKSKLAKKVYDTSKKVIRSKITHGVVSATAVAFPAVGVPAAAALATANVALNYVEQGQKVIREAEMVADRLKQGDGLKKTLTAYGAKYGKEALGTYVKSNPELKANLKMAFSFKAKVKAALTPARKAELKQTVARYKKGKRFLASVAHQARYATGARQLEAKKMAAIVHIAAANRARIRTVATAMQGGMPGILIDRRGRMVRGRFILRTAFTGGIPDVLVLADGVRTGRYRRLRPSKQKRRRLRAYAKRRRARRRAKRAMRLRGALQLKAQARLAA